MAITNEVVTRVVTYRSLPEPPYTPGILALFEMIQKQGISLQDQQKIEEIIRRNQLLSMPQLIKTGTESGEMLQAIHTVGEWFTNANRFVRGYKALQSVCRVEAPDGSVGTGFLVGPDLVLTNYHVVSGNDTEIIPENELYQKAAALTFRFGYLANGNQSQPGYTVKSKATSTHPALQTYSEPAKLDFALLQLNEAVGTSDKFGVVALDPREIATPENALILQHPGGREMEFHPGIIKGYNYDPQNEGKSRIHYTTNTQGGSSGSPVFDKFWNVIGLHHSGSTYPKLNNPITRETNEGIPLKAIWPYIERYIKNKA